MVNIIGSSNNGKHSLTPTTKSVPLVNETSKSMIITTLNSINKTIDTSTVSTLAGQLSKASVSAQARDVSLTRQELGNFAQKTLNKLEGVNYFANKSKYDAEIPNSDDPTLLARAESATKFTNGVGSNPFVGMPREQLALITYDDSGTFTTNERRAALEESATQEFAWRQQVVAQSMAEYNSTGKLTNFFQSVLDHFKSLPAIEQSQYPKDYESKLQAWIDMDFNYFTNESEGKKNNSIIESLTDKVLNGDSTLFNSADSFDENTEKR